MHAAVAGFAQVLIAPTESAATNDANDTTPCVEPAIEPAIEVEFGGRVRARIPGSISPALAAAVLKALSRR